MYKQASSRSQRSKGIKGKHVLQFCVLLGVCVWLIYQVKHSHDKRKEFEETDEKYMEKMKADSEIQRLGRKDLPKIAEIATDVEKHGEDEEEKEPEEVGNRHFEEELEKEDGRTREREEEHVNGGGGDGQVDEKEPEHGEEQIDEAKDSEENEGESEENHIENEGNDRASEENHAELEENEGVAEENHPENEESEGGAEENNTENEEHEGGAEEIHTENEENEDGTNDHPEIEENENAETRDNIDPEENGELGREDRDLSVANADDHDHDGVNTVTHEAQEELYKADDASSEVAHNAQTINPETENSTTGQANELYSNVNFGDKNVTTIYDNDNGTLKKYESNSDEAANSTLLSLSKGNSSNSTAIDGEHSASLLSTGTQILADSNKTLNMDANSGGSVSNSDTTSGSSDEGKKLNDSRTSMLDETHEDQSSEDSASGVQHDPIDESDTDAETLPEIINEAQNTDDTAAE